MTDYKQLALRVICGLAGLVLLKYGIITAAAGFLLFLTIIGIPFGLCLFIVGALIGAVGAHGVYYAYSPEKYAAYCKKLENKKKE